MELVEDVRHPQDAVEADRGEQQPEPEEACPEHVERRAHHDGLPRSTCLTATRVETKERSPSARAPST